VPNKHDLYIVGAGDFGRELECLLEMIPETDRDFKLIGFINDDLDALDNKQSDYQILGSIRDFPFKGGDKVLLAIADPSARETIYHLLKDRVGFASYIHPNVTRFKFTEIGEGAIIVSNCVISTGAKLGRFVILNQGTQIGHDCILGDFCSVMSGVNLGGDCVVGNRVFMGLSATLIPKMKVGDEAKIGSGSVVIRNVKPQMTVFGNPAKVI